MAGICVALAVVAFVAYHVGGASMSMQVQATFTEAQRAYLAKRFELAYTHESPAVAVWEGTNLIAYLERDGIAAESRSKEDKAHRVFVNARLSALFGELGYSNRAQYFAREAAAWYQKVSTNKDVTAKAVVEEILARDHLKRLGH